MEEGNQSGDLAISGGHGNAQEECRPTPWEEEESVVWVIVCMIIGRVFYCPRD